MPKKHFLLLFLVFRALLQPICGQDIAFRDTLTDFAHDWQEQILQQVDIEELGEAAYLQLLDEISELVVWNDTVSDLPWQGRIRQHVTLSNNRCLSSRAGFLHPTAEKRAAGKAYLGDPWHHTVRYRMQLGKHLQTGVTLEKDPGEAWGSRPPYFDSWHAFARLRNLNLTDRIRVIDAVIGHYRLRMGCGLLISQGFSLGKQYLTQQLFTQRSNVLTPHSSVTEAGFMQGVAADLRLGKHVSFLPYFSARQIDGTLDGSQILTALQTDGYHRTMNEQSHRDAAWQFISGVRLGWRGEWYDVGLHGSYTHLQYDYRRRQNYYNHHYFRGHELLQASTDYSVRALGAVLHGELAIDDGGAIASVNALQFHIGDRCQTSLLHRYYSRQYRQLHASSVSESSGLQGEQGILFNVEGQISRHWQVQGMFDWFAFSQPQFGIRDTCSQGIEGAMHLRYSRNSRSRMLQNAAIGYRIKQKGDYIRHSFDANLLLHPSASTTCRTQLRARIYSEVDNDPSYGYAISQSAGWRCLFWPRFPFTIEGQACYFLTDDYDSRVYLTERTILYGFGLPMLYGQGLRYSLTSTIAMGKRINLDLKWAMTNYANRSSIGSGLQEIHGNNQQDLWLQLRIKI